MIHQRGWTNIAKEVEEWLLETYPTASYEWINPIKMNPSVKGEFGTNGGGVVKITADGYRDKSQVVICEQYGKKKLWRII